MIILPIFKQLTLLILTFLLVLESIHNSSAQEIQQINITRHIASFNNSLQQGKYRPIYLRYLEYNNQNNSFNLLLDKGEFLNISQFSAFSFHQKEEKIKEETERLLEYFFIGLSLPNESFWVNLRPDSEDNIIDSELAKTDIGNVFLEARCPA